MKELLFIMGAPKTCTSTIMGILNCHPNIFIMAESFHNKKVKHGSRFYEHYKTPLKHTMKKNGNFGVEFSKVRDIIDKGDEYIYFGDKWAILGSFDELDHRINELQPHRVICTVRDLRTWLCHDFVVNKMRFHKKQDVVVDACRYVYYTIKFFELKNRNIITLENFVEDNGAVLDSVDSFLPNVSLRPFVDNWWEKIGKYSDINKNIHKWWNMSGGKKKYSSFAEPKRLDVKVETKDNEMWRALLPVFDKYHLSPNKEFAKSEIDDDLKRIRAINIKKIKLEDCYKNVQIKKVGVDE